MELAFQTSPLHFLRSAVQEVHFQEETAESIVPDSYPDIAAIADCYADAILRGKDCRDGSVTIAGGIKGGIFYTPEDGTYPRKLELYMPVSMKLENPALTSQAQVLCSLRVRSVDARMINSRKAMLRVSLGCEITAYEEATEELCSLQGQYPGLETKTASYEVCLPLETSEKSFVITDTLELGGSRPPIVQLYQQSCRLELSDRKLVGNKAVFKGMLHFKALYLSENETLYLHQQQIPFSQYCELQRDYDGETVSVLPVVTGYDLELDDSSGGQQMLLSVNVLAQCVVTGKTQLQLLEDAYCTQGNLEPQWKTYDMDSCLDRQSGLETARQYLSGSLRELLDTTVYWDYPVQEQQPGQVKITVPVTIRVLGYNNQGELTALTGRTEAVQTMALSDTAFCRARAVPEGEVYTMLAADGAETRCTVSVETVCFSKNKLRTLCGGVITEQEEPDQDRPSVIIRTMQKDASLWEIAKAYGTTEAGIRAVNHLEGDRLAEDTLLLLPIG